MEKKIGLESEGGKAIQNMAGIKPRGVLFDLTRMGCFYMATAGLFKNTNCKGDKNERPPV